jgi:hypothetical protein
MNRSCPVGLRLVHIGSSPNHVEGRLAVSCLNQAGQFPLLCLRQKERSHSNDSYNGENETFHDSSEQATDLTN